MKKENNFKDTLPEGYHQVFHINAKDKKIGIVLNLIAFAVLIAVFAAALTVRTIFPPREIVLSVGGYWSSYLIFIASTVLYIVLHELVHGAAYKALTGRKLTFGMSWSCAFCGVPDIYVSRKTALIALTAPLIVFTIVFGAALALFYGNTLYYFLTVFLMGLHLGGCSGDAYMTLLLLFKYREKTLLMRDTGPEQFIYEKNETL